MLTRMRGGGSDLGMTLIELLVAMVLSSLVGLVTLSAVTKVMDGLGKVSNDTQGLTDVRTVQERLSRDLRQARGIDAGATSSQLSIWIDSNSDYVKTADEVVVWQAVNAPGTSTKKQVKRTVGAQTPMVVGRTLVSNAVFAYNNATVTLANVVTVSISYDAVFGKSHTSKHMQFSVTLRNFG
jgi:prepilin-type N-terminal cleavage/methylation domain-containing protein